VTLKKRRKLFFIIAAAILGLIAIGVLLFFTVTPIYHGTVLEVQQNNQQDRHPSIWVKEYSPEDTTNKTKRELRKMYEYQGIVFDMPAYIPDKVIKNLSQGQEVKIYYSGIVEASAPGGGDAYWVTIVDE